MSIFGVGTDRIAIKRVERSLERFGDHFIQRVYTDIEHQQAIDKGNTARRLAMLFAAKEAVSKSLGTGFRNGIMLRDIEAIHRDSGKPEVVLHGGAAAFATAAGISTVHLSLTDDDGVAMAFAIAES